MTQQPDKRTRQAARWDELVASGMTEAEAKAQVLREIPDDAAAPVVSVPAVRADVTDSIKAKAAKRPIVPSVRPDVAAAPKGKPLQDQTIGPAYDPVPTALRSFYSQIPIVGERASALARSIDQDIPYAEALEQNKADIQQFHRQQPLAALATTVLGNVAPSRAVLGAVKKVAAKDLARQAYNPVTGSGGATLGRFLSTKPGQGMAISGSLSGAHRLGATTDESLEDRLLGTLSQTAQGSGMGFALPIAAAHPVLRPTALAALGALAAPEGYGLAGTATGFASGVWPSGVTRGAGRVAGAVLPGKAGAKVGGQLRDVSEAMGSRGRVNRELESMEGIARPLRLEGMTGDQIVEFRDRGIRIADRAYERMRASVGNNQKLAPFFKDPDFKEAADLVMQNMGLKGTYLRPDVLHAIKQRINESVQGNFDKGTVLPRELAFRLQPKEKAFREAFHEAYPAARKADYFYDQFKKAEEALERGGEAARRGISANPDAEIARGATDVAGARNWAETLKHDNPTQQQLLREIAGTFLQRGAAGQVSSALDRAGLEGGASKMLAHPAFTPGSSERLKALGLALGSPEKAEQYTREAVNRAATGPIRPWQRETGWRRGLQVLAGEGKSPMTTDYGKELMLSHAAEVLKRGANASLLLDVAKRFGRGEEMLEKLNALGVASAGTPSDWSGYYKNRAMAARDTALSRLAKLRAKPDSGSKP